MGWDRPIHQIYVTLSTNATAILNVHPGWKVAGVMSLLEVLHDGPPPAAQRLIHRSYQLEPDETLSAAGVPDTARILLIVRLRGD